MHIREALTFVQEWLERPNARYLVPGPRHLALAFALLEDLGTGANLTTDVQLAALAIENDGEVPSSDADFGRFVNVRWVNPLRQSWPPCNDHGLTTATRRTYAQYAVDQPMIVA